MTRHRTRTSIGKAGWLLLILLGVVLIGLLYTVKTRAMQARAKLAQLEYTRKQEEADVKILQAELALLKSPQRLGELAEHYLGLQPVEAMRILDLENAVRVLPKKPVDKTSEGEE